MKRYERDGVAIIITEWALDSYLELLSRQAFSRAEYWNVLRPDVEKLRNFPREPAFQRSKFWSPADVMGDPISGGFKMKWHNIGNGRVQLRLPVALVGKRAFLCRAYVKRNAAQEAKELIRFAQHVELIERGRHTERGRL